MAGPDEILGIEVLLDVDVVPVNVIDYQPERSTGGETVAHTREDVHLVGFLPGRVQRARAGSPGVEFLLDLRVRYFEPGGAAVDYRHQSIAIALATRRDPKHSAESVT